jgi:hypothetical protein
LFGRLHGQDGGLRPDRQEGHQQRNAADGPQTKRPRRVTHRRLPFVTLRRRTVLRQVHLRRVRLTVSSVQRLFPQFSDSAKMPPPAINKRVILARQQGGMLKCGGPTKLLPE